MTSTRNVRVVETVHLELIECVGDLALQGRLFRRCLLRRFGAFDVEASQTAGDHLRGWVRFFCFRGTKFTLYCVVSDCLGISIAVDPESANIFDMRSAASSKGVFCSSNALDEFFDRVAIVRVSYIISLKVLIGNG